MHRTIQDYDFSYEGFMESAEQSLPLGNGDVGANVWLDRTGTLHLLFSKTDSWTELNRLVKTGHFSLALSPNPFAEGARFTLCLADGMLRIQAEKASVSLYADATRRVCVCWRKRTRPSRRAWRCITTATGRCIFRIRTHTNIPPRKWRTDYAKARIACSTCLAVWRFATATKAAVIGTCFARRTWRVLRRTGRIRWMAAILA